MRIIVDGISRWDALWFSAIFGVGCERAFSRWMRRVSWSADGACYPVLALLLLVLAPTDGRVFAVAGIAAFAMELPLYLLLKRCVRRDRPCGGPRGVAGRVKPLDRFSFPSGHTAAAFLVATLLGSLYPWAFPLVAAWAAAVGLSRVHLGVHYPTDTVAGMLLGVTSACCGLAVQGAL